MDENYEFKFQKALAEIDRQAIETVEGLKEDVLFVRDTFRKYGITREDCQPRVPLRSLTYPLVPSDEEVARFNEAEKHIHTAVNDFNKSITLQTAIAANIEMIYWSPDAVLTINPSPSFLRKLEAAYIKS